MAYRRAGSQRCSLYGGVRWEEKRPFCIGLLADRRITAAVCKQALFQGGVVGADRVGRLVIPPAFDSSLLILEQGLIFKSIV